MNLGKNHGHLIRMGWGSLGLALGLVMGSLAYAEELALPVSSAPQAVVWDSQHQQGAVAAGDQIWLFRADTTQASGLKLFAHLSAPGVAHFSLNPVTGDLFASATTEGTLKWIDMKAGVISTSVPAAGLKPSALFFHPLLNKLGSFNAGGGNLTLFDVASTSYEGLIPLADSPASVVMSADGRVLALMPERRELVLLAFRPFRTFARWPIPDTCPSPARLAVNPVAQEVYVSCGAGSIHVFHLSTTEWHRLHSHAAETSPIQQIFWDAKHHRLIALNTQGRVSADPAEGHEAAVCQLLPPKALADWDGSTQSLIYTYQDSQHAQVQVGKRVCSAPTH